MYLTDPKTLKPRATSRFAILDNEKIRPDDELEDMAEGRLIRVGGSFYSFLVGQKAGEAKKLPDIINVVRKAP